MHDFEIPSGGTTTLKMQVLPTLMKIHKVSKMVGDYNNFKPKLFTEKFSGNIKGCMGFIKQGNFYVPNTILKEDVRDMCTSTNKLVAVYSKEIKDELYSSLCYLAKGIKPNDIKMPKHIKEKIDNKDLYIEFNY